MLCILWKVDEINKLLTSYGNKKERKQASKMKEREQEREKERESWFVTHARPYLHSYLVIAIAFGLRPWNVQSAI
jgi:hypothetical protein